MLAQVLNIQKELSTCWSTRELLAEFVDVFTSLSEEDRLEAIHILDSNLVFSTTCIVDFMFIVRKLEEKLPDKFDKFKASMPKVSPRRRKSWIFRGKNDKRIKSFAVMADIDDTLLPSADALGIGGCDTSWVTDGTLYPGVATLHRVLRGDHYPSNPAGTRGYTVCLTARPAALTAKLGHTLRALGPRLSILPGNVMDNLAANNADRYDNYALSKLEQFNSYSPWFAGEEFVFQGDTGQGDVKVAEQLLRNSVQVAFCALHIVKPATPKFEDDNPFATEKSAQEYFERKDTIRLLQEFPGRIFFYSNIKDLAKQLEEAFWISKNDLAKISADYETEIGRIRTSQRKHTAGKAALPTKERDITCGLMCGQPKWC